MSIESDLKKDGIKVIRALDTLSVNTLAHDVAEKICSTFTEQNFIFHNLFIALSRIPMYIAEMPDGFAEANYFYKNSSIYFKSGISVNELEKFAVHEFIHYLQEIKDKKGNLVKLGLCDFGDLKIQGLALNEGAVQFMASKALDHRQEIVKYYEISLPTNSPSYYPLLCNLVAQMAYVTGEEYLFDSTFYGTSLFIIKLNNKLVQDNCEGMKAQKVARKISKLKAKIKEIYFNTQDLIYTSYFNTQFSRIATTADIDSYRFRLYNYKNYIGITENYSNFNDFYINKMVDLDNKYENIMNNTQLVVSSQSTVSIFFRKIKALLGARIELQ